MVIPGATPRQDPLAPRALLARTLIILSLLVLAGLVATYFLVFRYSVAAGLYWPFDWLSWGLDDARVFKDGFAVWSSSSVLMIGLYALLSMQKRSNAIAALHGSAHWATPAEVRASGLLPGKSKPAAGVYVGGWREKRRQPVRYLRHDGPEHVLAFAPTRSGKGVGLVLPTLLSWRGSALVYDIKGENWALTAGWRQSKANNRVMKFDPTSEDGVAFNPLAEIRVGMPQEVSDTQNVATMLVDPDGKGLDDHWSKTSYALLTGAILHALYAIRATESRTATLADVGALLSDPERTLQDTLEAMLDFPHRDGEPAPLGGAGSPLPAEQR